MIMRAAVTNNKMIRFLFQYSPPSLSLSLHYSHSRFLPLKHWFHLSARMQLWISWRIHLRQSFTVEQIAASWEGWGAGKILNV